MTCRRPGFDDKQGNTASTEETAGPAAATAADVVAVLKAQQATTKRMIGVIGHGALGRKVVHLLQQRGVAAVALGATPPAHLSVDRVADSLLQILASDIPGGQALLQKHKLATAKAGIAAGAKAYGAAMRTHPKQLAADAKQQAKRERRAADRQRTLQGKLGSRNQAAARVEVLSSCSSWLTPEVAEAMAEGGLVISVASVKTL